MIDFVGLSIGMVRNVVFGLNFLGGGSRYFGRHGVDAFHREKCVVDITVGESIHLRSQSGITGNVKFDAASQGDDIANTFGFVMKFIIAGLDGFNIGKTKVK